jgi:hypothetical protein
MSRREKKEARIEAAAKWGARLTWRSPWFEDTSLLIGLADRPVLMDSGWFHDSSSDPAFGYIHLRRVVVFHHQSSVVDRRSYIDEIETAPVTDDIGTTATGGKVNSARDLTTDIVWLEYVRDHTAVY